MNLTVGRFSFTEQDLMNPVNGIPPHAKPLLLSFFSCRRCGGRLRILASIEAPAVIERILEHLGRNAEFVDPAHPSRAPPECDRLI